MNNRKPQVMDVMWGTATPSRTALNILSGVGCNLVLKISAGSRIEKAIVGTSTCSLLSDNMKFLWSIIRDNKKK